MVFPTLLELYSSWILVPCGALLVYVPGLVVDGIPLTIADTIGVRVDPLFVVPPLNPVDAVPLGGASHTFSRSSVITQL